MSCNVFSKHTEGVEVIQALLLRTQLLTRQRTRGECIYIAEEELKEETGGMFQTGFNEQEKLLIGAEEDASPPPKKKKKSFGNGKKIHLSLWFKLFHLQTGR